MSYHTLVADFNNMFLKDTSRHTRSSSLPREMYASRHDRRMRSNSIGPDNFSSCQPAMPFRQRAMSVPADDYIEAARSRYARNLSPCWYNQPRSYSHNYYLPSYYYYSHNPSNFSHQPSHDYDYPFTNTYDHDYGNLYTNTYHHDYGYPYTTTYHHEYRYPYTNIYNHDYNFPYSSNHDNEYDFTYTPNISLSDYYGSSKCSNNPYSSSRDVLGNWRLYNRSANTLNTRNRRATSPLVSRELDRYFSTSGKTSYMGDYGSKGSADFRHYNYRSVPYFGASDNYHNLTKMLQYQNRVEGREF